MKRYVIVGNGVAGDSAACRIREKDAHGVIDMFTREEVPFYYRPRLVNYLAGEVMLPKFTLHNEEFYRGKNISLHRGTEIAAIDVLKKEAVTADGRTYPYDALLLATGAQCFVPAVAGIDEHRERIFTIKTSADVDAVRSMAEKSSTALVIGGGLLGLETAYGLSKTGLAVKIVEFFPRLLPRQLDSEGASLLQAMLEEKGLEFYLGEASERIEGGPSRLRLMLKSGKALEGDMIVISAGVRPDMKLAIQAGLGTEKGILVDDMMKTDHESIFAAGDAVMHRGRVYGIWPPAKEQGEIAGENMAGGSRLYSGTLPSHKLKVVGIDLLSAGEIDGEGRMESHVIKERNLYRKAVIADGKVAGVIMLGPDSAEQAVLKAIGQDYETIREVFEKQLPQVS